MQGSLSQCEGLDEDIRGAGVQVDSPVSGLDDNSDGVVIH